MGRSVLKYTLLFSITLHIMLTQGCGHLVNLERLNQAGSSWCLLFSTWGQTGCREQAFSSAPNTSRGKGQLVSEIPPSPQNVG